MKSWVQIIRLLMLVILVPLLSAATCAEAKPVVRSVLDVARAYCVLLVSEDKPGISAEEVQAKFCETEAQLRPYVNALLSAKQGIKAGAEASDAAPPTDGGADQ